jgi:hypothetical protein
MTALGIIDDFAQHFDFIHANTDALKRECYQIRFETGTPESTGTMPNRTGLDIDQYDAHSLHILLRHRDSRQYVAAARVTTNQDRLKNRLLPFERSTTEPVYVDGQLLTRLCRSSYSEISRVTIHPTFQRQNPIPNLLTGLYLAAVAMARLEFHLYTFTRLDNETFKRLRAQGLGLEHANPLPTGTASSAKPGTYYLNVEAGIATTSPSYTLYQHILNEIAHQLHMPQVMEGDNDTVKSA